MKIFKGDRPSFVDETALDYMTAFCEKRENTTQRALRDITKNVPMSIMQIGVDQAQLMALLVLLCNTERAIEVGVFTGYSALTVAQHLPKDGTLVACDISAETTAIGERHWAEAGVRDRIDLRIGPAVDTLDALIADNQAGSFDFAFIDADKASLHRYYEQCIELLRPGGLLAVDNQFMFGRAFHPEPNNDDAIAVNALTTKAFEDERVEPALLAVGDGLLLARKA